jgi:hypothetical protein
MKKLKDRISKQEFSSLQARDCEGGVRGQQDEVSVFSFPSARL